MAKSCGEGCKTLITESMMFLLNQSNSHWSLISEMVVM